MGVCVPDASAADKFASFEIEKSISSYDERATAIDIFDLRVTVT